jgi:hypothetical protein
MVRRKQWLDFDLPPVATLRDSEIDATLKLPSLSADFQTYAG